MKQPVTGEAIILSQDDADEIARAVGEATEIIWTILSRRRILLRPPVGDASARIKRPRPPKCLPFDELF